MARKKSPPRTRIIGSDPILLSSLATKAGDSSMEARSDGVSGRGDASRVRGPRGSTEPLPMSDMQRLEGYVAYADMWDLSHRAERDQATVVGAGRKSECSMFEMLLFDIAT